MTQGHPATFGDLSSRFARLCNGGACVRVAANGDTVVIGDTKNPDGPVLAYSRTEFRTFIEGVRQGDFDDLI